MHLRLILPALLLATAADGKPLDRPAPTSPVTTVATAASTTSAA